MAMRGGGGGHAGQQGAQIVEIRPFLEFEVEVFFGEIEMGETMFVHELDDFTDFL